MPINRLVVKEEVATYASVLLNSLHEAGGQDAVLDGREQLDIVARYIRSSIDLSDALNDTSYSKEQRSSLARTVFTDAGMNPILVDVLSVMAERNDIRLLPRVFQSYGEQLEAHLNITVVDVVTSVPLDDHLRQIIKKKAAADLGTDVVLNERIDGSILGGIVMSAHGMRIDASVNSQLESARNVLKLSTDGGES